MIVSIQNAVYLDSRMSGGNRRICRSQGHLVDAEDAIGFDTCLSRMLVSAIVACIMCWKMTEYILKPLHEEILAHNKEAYLIILR